MSAEPRPTGVSEHDRDGTSALPTRPPLAMAREAREAVTSDAREVVVARVQGAVPGPGTRSRRACGSDRRGKREIPSRETTAGRGRRWPGDAPRVPPPHGGASGRLRVGLVREFRGERSGKAADEAGTRRSPAVAPAAAGVSACQGSSQVAVHGGPCRLGPSPPTSLSGRSSPRSDVRGSRHVRQGPGQAAERRQAVSAQSASGCWRFPGAGGDLQGLRGEMPPGSSSGLRPVVGDRPRRPSRVNAKRGRLMPAVARPPQAGGLVDHLPGTRLDRAMRWPARLPLSADEMYAGSSRRRSRVSYQL